ncbi:MAG: peptidoglycan DD-metalloendopeptidase family protein, partial [Gammaproteobacteria bacterium]
MVSTRRVGLLISVLVLAGCANEHGLAPVDFRGEKGSGGDVWREPVVSGASHKVVRGDTLYSIAFQHNLNYQELAAWNGIGPPYLIRVGEVLRLSRGGAAARSGGGSGASAQASAAGSVSKSTTKRSSAASGTKNKPASATSSVARTPGTSRSASSGVPRGTGPVSWRWPTSGRVIRGFSRKDIAKKGIGIAGKAGQKITAAGAGKVVYAGSGLVGYGKLLIIKHNSAYLSAYAHNNKLLVSEGAWVKRGQAIAEMGSSGTSRPMLHFEIRKHGKPVNPLRYLPKR